MITKSEIGSIVQNNFPLESNDKVEDKRFYVYGLFYEKEDQKICFYIGKGTDDRHKTHFRNSSLEERCYNSHKNDKIKKLKEEDKNPYSKILFKDLTEDKALGIEEFLLKKDCVFDSVTNIVRENFPLSGEDHPLNNKERPPEVKEKMATIERAVIEKVNWLVENSILTSKEIAKELDISDYTVKDVKHNRVRSHIQDNRKPEWYDEDYKKEIKQQRREKYSDISKQEVREIRWLREETEATHKQIAEKYGYSSGLVCSIAHENILGHLDGSSRPSWVDSEFIQDAEHSRQNLMVGERNPSNVLPDEKVKEINWMINNTDLTHDQISNQYKVSSTLISAINLGRTRSYIEETKKPEWYSEEEEKTILEEARREIKKDNDTIKLTDDEVREVRWLIKNTDFYQKDIAHKYKICAVQASNLKHRKSRSYVKGTKKPDWFESEESCSELT